MEGGIGRGVGGGEGMAGVGGAFNVLQGITLLEMSISYNQFPDNTCLERQIGGLLVHCTQTLIKPFKTKSRLALFC